MARTQGSRAEITGPLIRKAAQQLFARHGFAAVSMRQIAAAVGVQVGTLYSYTPDKQSLLMDLLQQHMQAVLQGWRDDPAQDPLTRLQLFVHNHIATSLDHQEAVFLSYMELRNLAPENHRIITAQRRQYENALEAILRDGQQAGVMQLADTRMATLALIGMLTGVTNWYRDGGRVDRATLKQMYWDLARGTVGG